MRSTDSGVVFEQDAELAAIDEVLDDGKEMVRQMSRSEKVHRDQKTMRNGRRWDFSELDYIFVGFGNCVYT